MPKSKSKSMRFISITNTGKRKKRPKTFTIGKKKLKVDPEIYDFIVKIEKRELADLKAKQAKLKQVT